MPGDRLVNGTGVSRRRRRQSTAKHAARLRSDFLLGEADSIRLLATWNKRNRPPLEDGELRAALANGKKYAKGEPGCKAARAAKRRELVPFVRFPTFALPEPLRGFTTAGARAIGCDDSYLALTLLVAVGTTRRLRLKHNWSAPSILWGALVGESGTSKTPCFGLAMRPIRERQQRAHERHVADLQEHDARFAHYERDNAAWKRAKDAAGEPPLKPESPAPEKYVVSDTTVEALAQLLATNPRGLLLARDELAGWLGSFDRYAGGKGGTDSAHWLSMHSGGALLVDRKTGNVRSIYVPSAAISIVGGVQPGILHRALGREHRENGLAARLLLASPPRRAKVWSEADVTPNSLETITGLFDRLFDLRHDFDDQGHPTPVLLRLSPSAKEPWINYVNLTGQEQVELVGELAAAWSKLEEYAARLALIVHLVRTVCGDADPAIVDEESMLSGITLATWFKGEAKRVYGLMSESPDEADERRLVEWVAARGGEVTAREVQMGCRWLRDPGAAEKALCELAKVGLGEWVQSPSGRRGQPTRRFRMSAPSTVNGNGVLPEEIGNTVDVDTVGTRGIKDPDAANDAFAGAAAGSAGDRGTTSDTDLAA